MEKKQSSIDYLIEQLEGENNRIAMVVGVKKYNSIVKEAKAMHKEEIESNNKINLAINEFERLKSKAGSIRDIIYLDGVLAVLDSIKNETFGGDNE